MTTTLRRTSLAFSAILLAAGTAHAEDVCPRTSQWGQAQDFWTPDPTTGNPRRHLQVRYDGRWAGAAQVPLDNGLAGARARFLEGGDGNLYIALELDTIGRSSDRFWVGYTNATATDSNGATLLEISLSGTFDQAEIRCGADSCPAGSTCSATACGAVPAVYYRLLHGVTSSPLSKFQWDGTAFDNTANAKTWMSGSPAPRAWRGALYAGTGSGEPNGVSVLLRIPNAQLGNANPVDLKVWVAAATCQQDPANPTDRTKDICSPMGNWPSAGEVSQTNSDYSAPAVTDWGILHRTTACPAQGTLVEAGVQHGAGWSDTAAFSWPQQIFLDNDGNPSNDPKNWFGARVSMPIPTDGSKYRARFFIADWGSQIGNLDSSQWSEIGSAVNRGLPAAGTENLSVQFPTITDPAALLQLSCKYSKCTAAVLGCPYPEGMANDPCVANNYPREHHPHQCTQVRLESMAAAASYQFAQDSMIFNTDFVGASVFWREATISTQGIDKLKPAPGPAGADGRDIYIHVRASNLPNKSDEIPAARAVTRIDDLVTAMGKPQNNNTHLLPSPLVQIANRLRERLGQDNEPSKENQRGVINEIRRLPMDTVRMIAPTLEFDVYYDTGRIMDTFGGKTRRWLGAMTSFRYVVEHVGKIKGWEWAVDGADPLGDGWFHLRLRDGDKQRIRTRVQAVEDGRRMPPGNPVWPPGKAWINAEGKPGTAKVKVKKSGGCSVGDDSSSGALGVLMIVGAAAFVGRRRRARA